MWPATDQYQRTKNNQDNESHYADSEKETSGYHAANASDAEQTERPNGRTDACTKPHSGPLTST